MRTHTPTEQHGRQRVLPPGAVAVALAAAVAVLVTVAVTRAPRTVDRLTVDNPHPWELALMVSAGGDGPRTPLPVARAGERNDVPDVLEQGPVWVFHPRIAGVELEPIQVTRAQLAADDWVLRLPDDVAGELRDAGVPLTPE